MFRNPENTLQILRNRRQTIAKSYERNDSHLASADRVTTDLALDYTIRLISLDIQDALAAKAIHRRTADEIPVGYDVDSMLQGRISLLQQIYRGDFFGARNHIYQEGLIQLADANLFDANEGIPQIDFAMKLIDVKDALPFIVNPTMVKRPLPPWLENTK